MKSICGAFHRNITGSQTNTTDFHRVRSLLQSENWETLGSMHCILCMIGRRIPKVFSGIRVISHNPVDLIAVGVVKLWVLPCRHLLWGSVKSVAVNIEMYDGEEAGENFGSIPLTFCYVNKSNIETVIHYIA